MKLKQDLKESSQAFLELAWPQLVDRLGGGEIMPVETVTDSVFADTLDQLAGIDAWQVFGNREGIRGIASRMQKNSDFRTFTIRYRRMGGRETEWAKRIRAIDENRGALLPFLSVQGYYDTQERILFSAAAIRTTDLFDFMRPFEQDAVRYREWEDGDMGKPSPCRRPPCFMRRVGGQGNWFFLCPWELVQDKCVIWIRQP